MDRFHLMAVYVAVAEEESFAAGARRLGMSPPAVTRAIAALEKRLGVKLLTRTTRYVRATDAGRRYLEHTRRILADADEADEAAAGVNAAPRGRLTVTAPVLFGRMFVTPGVVDFLRRYPEISVSALLLDRVVSLIEEGIDVGVRIGDLPDSSLHAITVGQVHRVVCASPAYLKANGVPRNPADLAAHTIIAANPVSPSIDWKFEGGKKPTTVKLVPRLTVTNNDAAIVAALEGFGITRLMSYQIGPLLASGQLKAILQDSDHARLPIHILHGEGGRASAKVRVFVDSMVTRLRSDKSLGYSATH
jgi:DNA-binding transcriptional LysR family regulator